MKDEMTEYYERYWEEVEENLKLREELEQLKWKINCLEKKNWKLPKGSIVRWNGYYVGDCIKFKVY
jgi:hypothetical protein